MKYAIAIMAVLAGTTAYATTEEQACREFAETTRIGTEAGNAVNPLTPYEAIARAELGGQTEMYRLYMSAFLMGYSGGLLGDDPNASFVTFYTNCVAEGV